MRRWAPGRGVTRTGCVLEIADAFLAARFDGAERHRRRLEKLDRLEGRWLKGG